MRTLHRAGAAIALATLLAGCRIDVPAEFGAAPDGYHRMADGTLMADAEAAFNGHDHDVDPDDFPSGVVPVRLQIDRIGVDAPIVATAMTAGRIQGPPVAGDVAWLEQTRRPGEIGPAILGGVDVLGGDPGAYAALGTLAAGDVITVISADGEELRFLVADAWTSPVADRADVFRAGGARPEVRLVDWAIDGEADDHVVTAFLAEDV